MKMTLSTTLFIIFLILKLCEVITWSWWWVTSPLWIPIVLSIGILGLCLVLSLIAWLFLFGVILIVG